MKTNCQHPESNTVKVSSGKSSCDRHMSKVTEGNSSGRESTKTRGKIRDGRPS